MKLVLMRLCRRLCEWRKALVVFFGLLLPLPLFLYTCAATAPLFGTSTTGTVTHLALPWLAVFGILAFFAFLSDAEVDCRRVFVELAAYQLVDPGARKVLLQNFPLLLATFSVKLVTRTIVCKESRLYGDHPSGNSGTRSTKFVLQTEEFVRRSSAGDFADTFETWDDHDGSGQSSTSYSFGDQIDFKALEEFIDTLKTCDSSQAQAIIEKQVNCGSHAE